MASNEDGALKIRSTTIAMTSAIKHNKKIAGLKKEEGFTSNVYQIVRHYPVELLNAEKVSDEIIEKHAKSVDDEYAENPGYAKYEFYATFASDKAGFSKKGTMRLFFIQRNLPSRHIFITKGVGMEDIDPTLKEAKKYLKKDQELVLTLDMNLPHEFFNQIVKEYPGYRKTFISRKKGINNAKNYKFLRDTKYELGRHMTNLSDKLNTPGMPTAFDFKLMGIESVAFIKYGGASKKKIKKAHPYKITVPVEGVCAFDASTETIKPLYDHKANKCQCTFHQGRGVLTKEVLQDLVSSDKGLIMLEMHSLETLAVELQKPLSELRKVPAILEKEKELRTLF